MNDIPLFLAYIALLGVFYVTIGWLHVRSMNQLDDEKTYTMREELHPKTMILGVRENPQSMAYSIGLVLCMVALRYDSVAIALLGSGTLVGTAYWTNKKSSGDENGSED